MRIVDNCLHCGAWLAPEATRCDTCQVVVTTAPFTAVPLNLVCSLGPSGYGNAARGLIQALAAIGIGPEQLRVISISGTGPEAIDWGDASDGWLIRNYVDPRRPPHETPGINIVHVHPTMLGRYYMGAWRNIAYCSWETSALPLASFRTPLGEQETIAESLNRHYEQVWVPTRRVQTLFREAGVTRPVYVVPHALTTTVLQHPPRTTNPIPGPRHPALNNGQGDVLRFYYIGSFDSRKHVNAVLLAYAMTGWTPADPVHLALQCIPGNLDRGILELHGAAAQEEIKTLLDGMPNRYDLPSYSLSFMPETYDNIIALHRRSHVFVTASRGEGFCLPAAEALAFGNTVVGTDVCIQHFSPFAPETLRLIPSTSSHVTPDPHYAGYEPTQMWQEIDVKRLSITLRSMLDVARVGKCCEPGGGLHLRTGYNPTRIGRIVESHLKEML